MDLGSVLLGLALLLVVAFVAVRPLLEQHGLNDEPATRAEQLINGRERVLVQLRDLDFDQATGKINADDYAAQRAILVAEGVAILKQLDALGVPSDDTEASSAAPDDPIEAAVARKRALRAPAELAVVTSLVAPSDAIEAAVARARARRASPPPAGSVRKPAAGTPKAVAAPTRSKPHGRDSDAEIEANIAQRRAKAPGAAPADASEKQIASAKPTGNDPPSLADGLAAALDLPPLSCAQCGTEVQANDRFCPKCGSPQTVACGNCGRAARAGDQFCAQCGQALPASVAGPAKA